MEATILTYVQYQKVYQSMSHTHRRKSRSKRIQIHIANTTRFKMSIIIWAVKELRSYFVVFTSKRTPNI